MRSGQLVAGRYRLTESVGRGGDGIVWRAVDQELGREVAVKRALSVDSDQDARRAKVLRREAKILARLNHPNIVTVFDIVPEGVEWLLVMEYVEPRSLAEQGTLSPGRAARLGAQVAEALEVVHAAGVLHRDIKPGNVLVTGDGRAKLGDFGISRVVWAEETLTDGEGQFVGTPGYAAPEVVRGEEEHSPASDVFSLGATLFKAVEGITPFGAPENPQTLLRRTAEEAFVGAERAGPLTPILSALLRADPAERPTVAEARRMLEQVADASDVSGTVRDRGFWRHIMGSRRWPVPVAGGLAGVVLAAVLTIIYRPSGTSPPPPPRPRVGAIGDARTADPCALTDPAALVRFGETDLSADFGNFDRCDVLVQKGGSEVDVETLLDVPAEDNPGKVQRIGSLGLVREQPEGDACARTLLLPDGQVHVVAKDEDGHSKDLCPMADAATAKAVSVLSRGPVPRRSARPAPNSLIRVNACALLDNHDLSRFPGVDALHPKAGFGDWQCQWDSTTDPIMLQLIFDQGQPPNASNGRPVRFSGHQAFVQPGGYGDKTCLVPIVNRRFVDSAGDATVEFLLVVVTGDEPAKRRCEQATAVAAPAAANLPR